MSLSCKGCVTVCIPTLLALKYKALWSIAINLDSLFHYQLVKVTFMLSPLLYLFSLHFPLGDGAATVTGPSLETLFRFFIVPISENRTTTVAAGEDVDLTCDAQHFTFRQWLIIRTDEFGIVRPEAVTNSSDLHRIVTPDLQLRFRGIRPEDQGVYKCMLSNVLGGDEVVANITVVGE